MSAKVVRTTARPGRDRWYVDLQENYTAGTEIVILPAADFDRMVEREQAARELVERASVYVFPDANRFDTTAPALQEAIHAFLAGEKGASDGK